MPAAGGGAKSGAENCSAVLGDADVERNVSRDTRFTWNSLT